MRTKKLFTLLIIVFLTACQLAEPKQQHSVAEAETAVPSPPTSSATLFQNVSRAAGITQTRQGNDRAIGQAWGDYDRDGWPDFYVTDTKGPNSLFRNNGDGTFSRPSFAAIVALPDGFSGGATFADYNNDGWPDLYVVNWGQNILFRNDAGQGFTDVTNQAGVGGEEDNSQTASWGDYNNDGWLDLYVANWACYPRCGRPNEGDTDRLYHNNGDGTFTEVTRLLNGQTYGAGFVASFTDYDNDGDQDIYLVNDEFLFPVGNKLWRNDGPGCADDEPDPLAHCFTEIAKEAEANTSVMGMGLATTDYDNDGDFDFYFSNAGPMTLLQNQGDGTFRNVAAQAGVEMSQDIAWATAALDYNNDGWQDLYLAVMTTVDHGGLAVNPLFHNNGDGTFSRIASGSGASDVGPTMGIATADFDNDGWVDLLLGNKDNGYSLLRNQGSQHANNHWLTLELVGAGPVNRDAVGSRVTVHTADGSVQTREVQNGSSLGAGNELRLHFGLGTFDMVEEMTIRWPNGRSQTFTNLPTNRQISLPYPLDAAAEAAQQAALYPSSEPTTNPLATNKLTTNILIAANVVAWLGLGLLIWRRRGQLGVSRRAVLGAGALVIGVITAVYLLTNSPASPTTQSSPPEPTLANRLAQAGAIPPVQLPAASEAEIELGRALFWDPLLSGNKDTACVTCHHPDLGTGDALPLSIGTGGQGLGTERQFVRGRQVLIPRNATPIYNLGLAGMDVLFWDGRVSLLPDGQFDSPANDDLPYSFNNAIAVQAMFPVTSQEEMRGHAGDTDIFGERNRLGNVKNYQFSTMWQDLLARILAVPGYQELFQAAYPNVPLEELHFAHAANALATYQMDTFTFLDSPWDRYLLGDETALSAEALAGAELFYGEAGCADCHSGSLLTDLQFHNIGVPQIGPGKGNEEPLDFGRARETGYESDLFAFRTPPLRNVAITGPWMHNGAYDSLEAVILHHLNPREAVANYDFEQLSSLMLAEDSGDTAVHTAALNAPSFAMPTRTLTDAEIGALVAFLEALTSPTALDLSHTIPDSVPSGLPVGGTIQ